MGGAAGIIRSSTPGLFAIASGIQCFALGGSFWAVRQSLLTYYAAQHAGHIAHVPPRSRTEASTIAGGIGGASTAALFRGRANVLPGFIMFSLFGFFGQSLYNVLDTRHSEVQAAAKTRGVWHSIVTSRFNPVKTLSDEEYEHILMEKLIRIEAEIALVNDDLLRLKNKSIEPNT